MKNLFAILAILFSTLPGMAQIGSSVVTATNSFTTNSGDVVTLKASITGCAQGALPLYNGVPISITPNQTPLAPFTATGSSGAYSVTFTVPGNDAISCSNQNYTLYALTWYDNGFPLAPTVSYRFTDNSTLSLANLVPISFIPPVLSNAAGALCPAASPIFMGFNALYQIQCAANSPSSTAALPITGGTLLGNLIIPSPYSITTYASNEMFTNGIPNADQFVGSPNDFCGKLRAAEVYALANNLGTVDASHFPTSNACTVDPFVNLGGTANALTRLKVILPSAVIHATVPVTINTDGLYLQGAGRLNTVWQYDGSCNSFQIAFTLGWTSGFVQFDTLKDFSVVTSAASGCTGYDFEMFEAHRNDLENMSFWGNEYGFVTAGAVTDTFYKLHVSNQDAAPSGWAGFQQPSHGFYFGFGSSDATTDGTVIDIAAESIAGTGIECFNCADMHFSAGTSESNINGIKVDVASKFNVFTAMDIEGNSANSNGVDFLDVGGENIILGGLYTSTCSACDSVFQTGGIGNDELIGDASAASGVGGLFNVLGNNSVIGVEGLGQTSMFNSVASTYTATAALKAPILTATGSAVTFNLGTGITSASCTTSGSVPCSTMRGRVGLVNGSATTAEILVKVVFPSSTASVPVCRVIQDSGTTYYGLFASSADATGFNVSSTNTISGITSITFDYECSL
jgi:hypothetical protein